MGYLIFFLALGGLFSIIKHPKAALQVFLLVFFTIFIPLGSGLLAQYFLGISETIALSIAFVMFIAGIFLFGTIISHIKK
jgi:hypothetical protein